MSINSEEKEIRETPPATEEAAVQEQAPEEKKEEKKGFLKKDAKKEKIAQLEKQMREAAKMLEFELAAALRDQIIELRGK